MIAPRGFHVACLLAVLAPSRAIAQPAPRIASLVPGEGPIAGGTTVVIRGEGFSAAGLSVRFGSVVATEVTVVGSTELRVTSPAQANGFAAVAVATAQGTAKSEFFYFPPSLAALRRGEITTVAGIGKFVAEGRPANTAPMDAADMTVDDAGNIYMSEPNYAVIRRIGADGSLTRYAGTGAEFATGEIGDGGPATAATLVFPKGIAIGPDGNVYVADAFNHRIRRIDRATGIIATVAGSGPIGSCCEGAFAGDNGPALSARFNQPNQVGWDPAGNMYVLDTLNYRIRRISTGGIVTTVAGTGVAGFQGDGGPAAAARIFTGMGADSGSMKIDRRGNIFLADAGNRRVRRIDGTTGVIITVVGGGTDLRDGVPGPQAEVLLRGIGIDRSDVLYFGDDTRIRRLEADGTVTTVFGTTQAGFSPDGTGPAEGRLSSVDRMTIDANDNILFVEFASSRLRRIDATTRRLSTIAGMGPAGFGENGPGIAAELLRTGQMTVTPDNVLIVPGNMSLRKLLTDGRLLSISGVGSAVTAARNGTVYAAGEAEVGLLRTDGMYLRLTNGQYGFSGDGGPAQLAAVDTPNGVALDAGGHLFVADTFNHRIRRIDAVTGIITTVAGNAGPHPPGVVLAEASSGDGGPATQAHLPVPNYLTFDPQGRLLVADTDRIRSIDSSGVIRTHVSNLSGPLTNDSTGAVYCVSGRQIVRIDGPEQVTPVIAFQAGAPAGDGGPAEQAATGFLNGIAIDHFGNVYLADLEYRRIRAIKGLVAPAPWSNSSLPQARAAAVGGSATFTTLGNGDIQWQRNGVNLAGQTTATLSIDNVQVADAGIFAAAISSGSQVTTQSALLGISSATKVTGTGTEVRADIVHPNTNVFDQVLLEGPAAAVTADAGQITRLSFVDIDDDIVQVEFSGAGTVVVVLDPVSGPALPVNYNQNVRYMKGHAAIIVTGAGENTHLSVFSVGRANAVDQTLFRDDVTYGGVADLAYIAIASADGKFGGLRTANANFFAARGPTGVYAPGVYFTGPVFVGDINASGNADALLMLGGAATDVRITGGDLLQTNGRAVQVSGIGRLDFSAGTTSHHTTLAAQENRAVLRHNGRDVTAEIAR